MYLLPAERDNLNKKMRRQYLIVPSMVSSASGQLCYEVTRGDGANGHRTHCVGRKHGPFNSKKTFFSQNLNSSFSLRNAL